MTTRPINLTDWQIRAALLEATEALEGLIGPDWRNFTKTEQTRMCGNSVPPVMAEALVSANVPEMAVVA